VHPVLFHVGSILVPSYGAAAAVGVLLGLALAQRTARVVHVDAAKVWNLCILSLFAALIGARLLLVLANLRALQRHPAWLLDLAMVHHPLVALAGLLAGNACAVWYARSTRLPIPATADALAAPLALGLAFEQFGALASGSSFGREAGPGVRWAVTYTNPLAAFWSGTPLGIPLHPVQAYAALAFFALAILLYVWLPFQRQQGDAAGLFLVGAGVAIYFTEIWRDPAGRGTLLHGALDGPQVAAVLLVLAGAWVLRERKVGPSAKTPAAPTSANAPAADDRGRA
jgi:phosphatidylglycerol---prolipoprotein diacylglyceryl transferase